MKNNMKSLGLAAWDVKIVVIPFNYIRISLPLAKLKCVQFVGKVITDVLKQFGCQFGLSSIK